MQTDGVEKLKKAKMSPREPAGRAASVSKKRRRLSRLSMIRENMLGSGIEDRLDLVEMLTTHFTDFFVS